MRRRVIALMLSGVVVLGVGGWLVAEDDDRVEPTHQVTRDLDRTQAPGPVPEPQEPPGGRG